MAVKDIAVDEKAILLLMNSSFDVYTNTEDGHYKFWAVSRNGFIVTCRWGKIGTRMQELEKDCKGEWAAKEFIRTKVNEKINKGYKKL